MDRRKYSDNKILQCKGRTQKKSKDKKKQTGFVCLIIFKKEKKQ